MKSEQGNRDSVHLYWNGADETWNAYGASAENALRISPALRKQADEAVLCGRRVKHVKVDIDGYEQSGLSDCCVAVDDEHLELRVPTEETKQKQPKIRRT